MQFILAEPLNIAVVSHIGAQDYILCVTETQIMDAAEGLELALRVREATGSTVPLSRIVFWRHASDEDLDEEKMLYRLTFMDELSKHALYVNKKLLYGFKSLIEEHR